MQIWPLNAIATKITREKEPELFKGKEEKHEALPDQLQWMR